MTRASFRPGRRLSVFLASIALLGLTTAVGLAWVAALIVTPDPDLNVILGEPRRTTGALPEELGGWEGVQWTQRGLTTRLIGYERFASRLTSDGLDLPPTSAASELNAAFDGRYLRLVEKESGWPLRCLRVRWGPYDPDIERQPMVVRGGVPCDELDWGFDRDTYHPGCFGSFAHDTYSTAVRHTALPLVPIWPGLLLNTAVFASVWGALVLAVWPLLALPRALRRRVRRARGRCLACGYDLQGLDGCRCPECGWAGERRRMSVPVVTPAALALLAVAALAGLAIEQRRTVPRLPSVFLAAESGDAHALRQAAAAGVDLAERCDQWDWMPDRLFLESPLAWAAANGNTEAVAALLDVGPNAWTTQSAPTWGSVTETIGTVALNMAAQHGHADVCRVLMDDLKTRASADPVLAEQRVDWVHYMVYYGSHHADIVALGIDEGFVESPEYSLINTVAAHGDAEVIALALDSTADREALTTDDWSASALATAYSRGNLEAFEMLLAAGANPRALDADARGMLHHAPWPSERLSPADAQRQRVALMRHAVSPAIGLEIDACDASGKTPLMFAVFRGETEFVRVLLDAGADPSILDSEQHSAFDYARGRYAFRYERLGNSRTETFMPNPDIVPLLEHALAHKAPQ